MSQSPGFLALVDSLRPHVKEVTLVDARARHAAGAHLVDIREQSEWAAGHAAGALYLGKGVLERDIEARIPDKQAEIILYCGGGYRSVLAADALQRMGYTNVSSMMGGWREWSASGAPTE
ncbi:MAG: sulfurtransferase [Gemmatimonadaceae bacterium]|nr:sulfurtransferase [Gemmatimonadaceae bacterium]